MKYAQLTLKLVVADDGLESLHQELIEYLDRLSDRLTIYSTKYQDEAAPAPLNAAEISAPE